MERERNISLDALRVFAILGVVTLHLLGGVNTLQLTWGNRLVVDVLLALTYCSVNLFGLLSGYLKIDRPHHYNSLMKIIFQITFWCFVIAIICARFFNQETLGELAGNVFPFINDRLWYVNCYFFVFLCAPHLNLTAKHLTQRGYKSLLLSLTFLMSVVPTFCRKDIFHVVSNGYSAGWLIFMYLLGGYYKLYGFGNWLSRVKALIIFLSSNCIVVLYKYLYKYISENYLPGIGSGTDKSMLFYYYCSPFMVLNSICILYLFVSISIKQNIIGRSITWLSEVSLGIYVIHAHPYCLDNILIGKNLIWIVQNNAIYTLLICVVMVFVIALFTGLLDGIRIIIFKMCGIDKLAKMLGNKMDKLLSVEERV